MKTRFSLLLPVSLVLSALAVQDGAWAKTQSGFQPTQSWQVFSRPASMPSFIAPRGMAIDSSGNLYVADSGLNQIEKLSPWGTRLAVFGSSGWRPGHFRSPSHVGVDQWGHVYVLDQGNRRIQTLSPTGRTHAIFDISPFGWVRDMVVDPWGTMYLLYYDHIQKLSPQGQPLATWQVRGSALAVDHFGNVYVTGFGQYAPTPHTFHAYITKMSPSGATLAKFQYGVGFPYSIAVDSAGYMYIFDPRFQQIIKLSPTGHVVAQINPQPSVRYGPLSNIVIDRDGNLLMADTFNRRINKMSSTGALLVAWGMQGTGPGRFQLPGGVATDRRGNVYVADTWNDRIQKLSPSGVSLRRWGSLGRARGQFNKPTAVVVNSRGNVVVADSGNSRLQIFSPVGTFIRMVRVPGPHVAYGYQPYPYGYQPYSYYYSQVGFSLAVDSLGNFVISDSTYHRVTKVSPTGEILATYSSWVTERYSSPGGVAIDRANNVYITDPGASHVVKLSATGRRLAVWGTFGYVGAGSFNRPDGIAIDPGGNIYVSDAGNHSIQELTPTGRPLRAWGMLGAARGQFAFPQGITVGPKGAIFVADTWNNRIQRLKV